MQVDYPDLGLSQHLHRILSDFDPEAIELLRRHLVWVELPAGEVLARTLTRSPRKEYDRKVEVWLLPGYAHLPGRIRTTEPNGDHWDMRLEQLPVLETGTSNTP